MSGNKLIGYERMLEPEFVKGLVVTAEEKLSKRIGKKVEIELVQEADDTTLETMLDIDQVFSPRNRYPLSHFKNMTTYMKDAFIFMVRVDENPAAFCLKYHQDFFGEETFFGDKLAVKEEFQKRGIGPMLMRLCIVMSHQMEYKNFVFYCEDVNAQGVNLQKHYAKLGFYNFKSSSGEDAMRKDLTDESISEAIAKIRGE